MDLSPFLKLHETLCAEVRDASGIPPLPVIETILFPDFRHAPIVRVDGSGMSVDDAARIEAFSPLAMVRLPEFARAPSHFSVIQTELNLPDHAPEDSRADELAAGVRAVAANHGVDLNGWRFWEIEIENDEVKARFVTSSQPAREAVTIDGITLEFYTDFSPADCAGLLAIFDHAKRIKQPFLPFLASLPRLQ